MPPKFSKEQMQASLKDPDKFGDWYVSEIVSSEMPHYLEDLGPRLCKTFSLNGRLYAEHFGIRRPDNQAQFITLMWELAANFFMVEEFQKILTDDQLSEDAKIDAVYSATEAASEKAMSTDNQEYWYPDYRP